MSHETPAQIVILSRPKSLFHPFRLRLSCPVPPDDLKAGIQVILDKWKAMPWANRYASSETEIFGGEWQQDKLLLIPRYNRYRTGTPYLIEFRPANGGTELTVTTVRGRGMVFLKVFLLGLGLAFLSIATYALLFMGEWTPTALVALVFSLLFLSVWVTRRLFEASLKRFIGKCIAEKRSL